MHPKKTGAAAVVTEAGVQAALRRGPARELAADEEKAMRMRLGASLGPTHVLERVGQELDDAQIELLAFEIEAYLKLKERARARAEPAPAPSRAKEKIIRALRRKK
jgi:hypothetical protein